MKIALDAGLMMHTEARQMITAAAELAGATLIVTETARDTAKLHYHRFARARIATCIVQGAAEQGIDADSEALAADGAERVRAAVAGFSHWLDAEPVRSGALFEIAPRCRATAATANELAAAGGVVEPDEHGWTWNQEPEAAAEALHAGAHWVASGSLEILRRDAAELWLEQAQHAGRFAGTPRPFVLGADGAVTALLAQRFGNGPERRTMQVVALAAALCTPQGTTEALARFGEELRKAGMTWGSAAIGRWTLRARARRETLEVLQETITEADIPRTLAAEARRREWEREADEIDCGWIDEIAIRSGGRFLGERPLTGRALEARLAQRAHALKRMAVIKAEGREPEP